MERFEEDRPRIPGVPAVRPISVQIRVHLELAKINSSRR